MRQNSLPVSCRALVNMIYPMFSDRSCKSKDRLPKSVSARSMSNTKYSRSAPA